MNLKTDDNGFQYFDSLEDVKPEYSPVKAWSVLQFFTLEGRKTTMIKENVIPILNLSYVVFAKTDKRYYKREYRNYNVDTLFFYYNSSGQPDEAVENLRRYIYDGTVTLLFTPDQVADTSALLIRLYKSHFNGDGKVPYGNYVKLLGESLRLEHFKDRYKDKQGFRTTIKMTEDRITSLWNGALTKTA